MRQVGGTCASKMIKKEKLVDSMGIKRKRNARCWERVEVEELEGGDF